MAQGPGYENQANDGTKIFVQILSQNFRVEGCIDGSPAVGHELGKGIVEDILGQILGLNSWPKMSTGSLLTYGS